MAKQRITVFLEPDVVSKLKRIFPGANDGLAVSKAVELYLESKDYSDWGIRTAVIARATMSMTAELMFPGDTVKQEQYMRSHVAAADHWVQRRLRSEAKKSDSASSSV